MLVIGEKVNATRMVIADAIENRDDEVIRDQITAEALAGADYIDLNAGTGSGDTQTEIDNMSWLIDIALDCTEKPFSIDSAEPEIIRQAAEHLDGNRDWLLNSVKNEERILRELLPLVAEEEVPMIALAMGGDTMPKTVEEKIGNCRTIFEEARAFDISAENILFDPLAMPLSSDHTYGQVALQAIRRLRAEFPDSGITVGVSNVSFGLRSRSLLNAAFLTNAITHGLDSPICDPTDPAIQRALILGELFAGMDRYCRHYSRAERQGLFQE
ncbi:MAG TPA: dihydropteroate synthase [bacterium]|nr:dihydropteroate synthase [bacterium]